MIKLFSHRVFAANNLPIILALLALSASLLMPPVAQKQSVFTLQVTFDISQSMNVKDVEIDGKAVTRLQLGRAAAQSLLLNLPCGSKLGWSVFAGRRVINLVTPLEICDHYAGLLSSLDQVDGRMRWLEASSVGKGVHQTMRAAKAIGEQTAVVFISDGHEAPPLRQGQRGLPDSSRINVGGLVVGVGGDTPVRIPKTDTDGNNIGYWQAAEVIQRPNVGIGQSHEELSRLHEDYLIKVAQLAELNYLRLDSVNALSAALKNARFAQIKPIPADLNWIPALLALLLLAWRFVPRFWRE